MSCGSLWSWNIIQLFYMLNYFSSLMFCPLLSHCLSSVNACSSFKKQFCNEFLFLLGRITYTLRWLLYTPLCRTWSVLLFFYALNWVCIWALSDRTFLMIMPRSGVLSFQGSICIRPLSDFLAESQLPTCLTVIKWFLVTSLYTDSH